jgi:hypothetical protein
MGADSIGSIKKFSPFIKAPSKVISSYVFMELTQPYPAGYMTSSNSFIETSYKVS